jgi:XTP/dITP diphosphohydrolase
VTSLLLATTNAGKLREIRELLAGLPIEFPGLDQIPPVVEPEETGATFRDNAVLKARYYAAHARMPAVAEDSGLVIDALDGEPGVRSARFVRPDATYAERFEEIERRLAARPTAPRTARFTCALAVVDGTGRVVFETHGVVEGEIATVPRGAGGFGYDPIFYYPPYRATLAEVSQHDKLVVAHRGQAFRALRRWLERGAA